jgi:pimeloyl-ACP methyl ester carboxylesterase
VAQPAGIAPFTISVPDEVLADLRSRLLHTRWPDPLPYPGWSTGVARDYLEELADYWATSFDWRAHEQRLNSLPQFSAEIDGQMIHFLHQRGRGPRPLPLVLTHGWPSCYIELLKLMPLLTNPAANGGDEGDSFDVVIPSLPGFAFSGQPARAGQVTARSMSRLWVRLMRDCLGYSRFGAQGQDIGGAISISLASQHPELVVGLHLTGVLTFPPKDRPLSEEGKAFLARQQRFRDIEGGYALQQATYPQTLAYGLNDSPVGLAAWILDKFRAWSDCDGDLERRFSKDELLTIITIYWVTGSINSSFLFYYDSRHDAQPRQTTRVDVPVGIALFPKENPVTGPREWAEQTYNIVRWTEMPRGGHFPASEEPELLATELREFFHPLR